MLVLCCCMQAFFHFGEWRLRSRSGAVPALVAEHRLKSPLLQQLQYMDLVAEACGISPDQGSNLCPHIGRRILNHWTTREVTT